ncbi:MAG: hypothetical protein R3F17_12365 [Planctomycetota bacterium]
MGFLDSTKPSAVDIVRAGAQHLGPERRMLLLHGPVGSSKSTIARVLKRGLEDYAHKAEGGDLCTFTWTVDGERSPRR